MATPHTIDDYIAQQAEWQVSMLKKLVKLVKKHAPDAGGAIQWKQPVFSFGGPMAYLKAEQGYVRVGFWRGAEIDDPDELLEGGGTKMRHVKIAEGSRIPSKVLGAMIEQAFALNDKHGDPTSRAALKRKPPKKKPVKKPKPKPVEEQKSDESAAPAAKKPAKKPAKKRARKPAKKK